MLRTILIAASFSALLAGCNTPGGGCPPLPKYSVPTQREAAAALRALPKGSAIGKLVVDYKKMRDACRVGAR